MGAYRGGVSTRRQSEYYKRTAGGYDRAHLNPGDGNYIGLEYMVGLLQVARVSSVLDIGAGTGRTLEFLRRRLPSISSLGIEPVDALLRQVNSSSIVQGVGEHLPFPDWTFDAVVANAVMHHVRDPGAVIGEMKRVARSVIMVSDANRFGQGRAPERWAKLLLWNSGLWKHLVNWRTAGTGSFYSEGDGEFYSYSIFDSVPDLEQWADRLFVIPTDGSWRRWSGALLGAPSALLVAIREPSVDWAGR